MGFASKCRSGLGVLPSLHRRQVLQAVQDDGGAAKSLIKALEASDRFRRDNGLGRIFHPGKVSYREVSPTNSLHVILGRKRISAHVDDVCPLRCNPDGTASYSWAPVIRHNVAGLVADINRRVRGLHGQQRCNLVCETVWVDDEDIAGLVAEAAGPAASASCEDGLTKVTASKA